jgi:tRNA U34 2-thiouridine synthase MnmA/TrmU
MVKALGLFSGGLDSILAVCVLREQGIEAAGVAFETPFFGAERARSAARRLGIPLIVRDITGPHLDVMKKPKHGFGSRMNPCIDCHALMVRVACGIMKEQQFDFVFTGEVLNERPMSQNRRALGIVERESGCEGYLLRPLSAKLLDETIPEKRGRVDREKLLALHGRTRKPQMELARKYGITGYTQPAGGCLLTDPSFSSRLKDLRGREGLDDLRGIQLLKVGRHFRLGSGRKAVVGRNEAENKKLESLARKGDVFLDPRGIPGPTVVLPGGGSDEDIVEAARLCARYSDAGQGVMVTIESARGGTVRTLHIPSPSPDELKLQAL